MNPIFNETVRRMLRRRREAKRKRLDSKADNGVYFPSEKSLPSQSQNNLPLLRPLNLLWFGLISALLSALCAFSPVLAVLLGIAGLDELNVYLKYGFLLALIIFTGIVVYAWRRNRS
jgi:mercuric ion transport protein